MLYGRYSLLELWEQGKVQHVDNYVVITHYKYNPIDKHGKVKLNIKMLNGGRLMKALF